MVIVDFVVASTLVLLASATIFWVVMHLWAYNFLNLESYYLARSRLYGNTVSCGSADAVVSQTWIKRYRYCFGTNVYTNYELLPEHLPQTGSFSLTLER